MKNKKTLVKFKKKLLFSLTNYLIKRDENKHNKKKLRADKRTAKLNAIKAFERVKEHQHTDDCKHDE